MALEKDHQHFDVVVVGGGPAGLTAALYTGRAGHRTLLLEKGLLGGLATSTSEVCNYPGFPEDISGLELMKRFEAQARRVGVEIKNTPVKRLALEGPDKTVETFRTVFHARAVVLATGGAPRLLQVPGEERFLFDKGISFCATCDAAQCAGKTVMVIGSGDAALEEGVFLTRFASKVIMCVRRPEGELRGHPAAREAALAAPGLELRWNSVVDRFEGGERLEVVVLRDTRTGALTPVRVDRCFLFIGHRPATDLFADQIALTERGYVRTDRHLRTSLPGVFAAGDVRDTCLRQIATAVGDGAMAGTEAQRHLASEPLPRTATGPERQAPAPGAAAVG